MSDMQDEAAVSLPVTEGTEDEILTALWSLCYDTLRGVNSADVLDAIQHIQEGNRCVRVAGELFEVIEPKWSVEQDVFGCAKGRNCTDVTSAQREQFETMIARQEAGDTEEQSSALEAEG